MRLLAHWLMFLLLLGAPALYLGLARLQYREFWSFLGLLALACMATLVVIRFLERRMPTDDGEENGG